MKRTYYYLVSMLLLAAAPSALAADVKTLMQNCNGCHGDNGVSQWPDVPTIAGLAEFVHSDALFIFRDKERPCTEKAYRQGDMSRPATDMCRVTADLSDDDIDALAVAYSELPYVRAKQEFDANLAAAGAKVHAEHCDLCHSDAGTNVDDEAGMLGGQWMGYLKKTFADFASGAREQPKKMKEKLDLLSDDDVAALLNYYASQQ